MERVRERGLDELIEERRAAGVPILGICLGLQLLFDSTTELGGRRGPRPARRARSPSSTPRASRSRTSAGRRCAGSGSRAWSRGSSPRPPSTSSTPSSRRRRPSELLGSAAYGARFACAAQRDNVYGVQFHPEKSSAAGLRLLSNFAGICAGPAARVILYPAIDIRGGQAVRLLQGDYERETAYDADPVDAARRWAGDGAALPPRRRPRRRQGRPARRTSRRCGGSPRRSSARSRSAAGCATPTRSTAVLAAGAARVVIGTAALRDPDFLDRALAGPRRPTSSSRSTPATARSRSRAGPRPAAADAAEVVAELGERGVQRFLFTSIDVDGTMEGPAIDELNAVAARRPARG